MKDKFGIEYSEDGKILLKCPKDYQGEFVIPNSVTEIGERAFSGCTGLLSIEIPNSVMVIGSSAFEGCSGLMSFEIPNGVTEIKKCAFKGCTRLTTVVWNIKVGFIDDEFVSPFSDICSQINSFVFGDDVEIIPSYLCSGMCNLTTITIPNSVKYIGYYAFAGCIALTSIEIPNSVTRVGGCAFWGCSGLASFEIPNSVTEIGNDAFANCTSITSIEIPNSVRSIGNSAFEGCTGLNTVELSDSVMSIGHEAFRNCTGLTSITIPDSVTSIGDHAFSGCTGLTSPVYNSKIFARLPINYNGAYVIPAGITTILCCSFNGCTRLASINIPNTVTSIEDSAFKGCTRLTSVKIPNSVTEIGESAFQGCTSLIFIEIPNSVMSIQKLVFKDCKSLTSVVWNAKKSPFDNYAQEYLDFNYLLYDKFEDTFSQWHPFYDIRNQITSFVFGDDVDIIPDCLCYEMKNLTSIIIPNGVTEIGGSAFEGCSGLTSIEIPNSVTEIGYCAFCRCSSLTSITIGNSVTNIEKEAFRNCIGLQELHIRNEHLEKNEVEAYAFENIAEGCTLYVPVGTGYAYRHHPVFGKFQNIVVEKEFKESVNTCGTNIVDQSPSDHYDVFISYAVKDYWDEKKKVIPGNVVSKVQDALKSAGITYWIDKEGLLGGHTFPIEIAKQIKNAKAFIFISSANANQSEWVLNEIATAREYGKTIIPFRADNSPYDTSLMIYLAGIQYVFYQDNPNALQQLVEAVRKAI